MAQIQHGSMRELQVRFVPVDQLEVTGFDERSFDEVASERLANQVVPE